MSKSDGQIFDFEKICRLCLVEKRSMSAIFSKKKSDKKVPLPVRIMSCASLEVSYYYYYYHYNILNRF